MGDMSPTSQSKSDNQSAGFGVNVQMADDSNFQNIIAVKEPTFVMFFATCECIFFLFLSYKLFFTHRNGDRRKPVGKSHYIYICVN